MKIRCYRYKHIKSINYFLLFVTLVIFACLVIYFIGTLCESGITIQSNKEGVINFQNIWYDCAPLIKAFIAFLTVTIASIQLDRYMEVETVNSLSKLRDLLMTKENMIIHQAIMDEENPFEIKSPDGSDKLYPAYIYNYLGVLELGATMIKRNIIPMGEFDKHFGYRIDNVINNINIRKHIENEKGCYEHLIFLINELQKSRQR